ncbi:TetR/AcrR family transcriptional regulator [Bacillus dakarensis]|uniref:TetR/AcrR family transcriptional regulator n=1 Tax=Robertmurraya dakarensis TaxID=1926278 RepID=UPI000981441D|nr:TetR/AcrR family transcriptional regulator [Bacillus dakarensis]
MGQKGELTTRQKRALETRKLIFETALSLILEKGFNSVHIEDIAKKAGTSVGLFYKYFKSKDEVVVEHYKKIDGVYLEAYENLDPNVSSTEKLVQVLKAGFKFSEDLGKEFLGVLFSNQFGLKGDIHYVMSNQRRINRIVRNIVQEGQGNGEFRTDLDQDTIVSMIFRCYTGSYFEWTLMEESKGLTEEGIKFLQLFIEAAISSSQRRPE